MRILTSGNITSWLCPNWRIADNDVNNNKQKIFLSSIKREWSNFLLLQWYTRVYFVRKVHFNNIVSPFVVQSRESGSAQFTHSCSWSLGCLQPPIRVIKTFFPIIFQLKQINYRRSFTLLVVDKYLLVFSYLSAKHFNFLWIVCCTLFYKNVQPEICQNIKGPIVYYVPEGGGVFQNSVVYQNLTSQIITYAWNCTPPGNNNL